MINQFQLHHDQLIHIIKQFDFVDELWLFGSYAYGKPNEESDIDLCVVVKDGYDNGMYFEQVNFAIFSYLVNYGVCHDLIMLDHSTKEHEKDCVDYVYYPIFHYGKRLL